MTSSSATPAITIPPTAISFIASCIVSAKLMSAGGKRMSFNAFNKENTPSLIILTKRLAVVTKMFTSVVIRFDIKPDINPAEKPSTTPFHLSATFRPTRIKRDLISLYKLSPSSPLLYTSFISTIALEKNSTKR